ncbi:MAG TPA: GTPase Era [Acidobacteriota bacterium]|nr:GTPase Era [Acidobacteriota bacterium]
MSKCGHIALIGRPNAGKSTLLNHLMGQKIAIVSDKPQTTRRRILGVLNRGEAQMIFVDTPGIHKPGYRLNQIMMDTVYEAIKDVDLLLHMVDASEPYGRGEQFVVDLVKQAGKPTLLLLNKADAVNKGRLLPEIEAYNERFAYQEIIPISASQGDNVEVLLERIAEHLPESDWLFPEDYFTDQQERFLASEIIREKVLAHTRREIPYSTAVVIEEFDESRRQEEESFLRITASILVDKPNHKKIVIGRGGRMIKRIGTEARKELKRMLEVKSLYLDLNVKVEAGWRDREGLLDQMGVIGR